MNIEAFNHKDYCKIPFITTQSDLLKYNNQDFEIVGEQTEGVDEELKPMWKIKFSDNFETDAFSDEIFDQSSILKINEKLEKDDDSIS